MSASPPRPGSRPNADDIARALELDAYLELFRAHHACKWLSDDRANGPLKPADGEWAQNDWAPRVMAAGWKFWAVVWPEKVVAQMNMKRWIA